MDQVVHRFPKVHKEEVNNRETHEPDLHPVYRSQAPASIIAQIYINLRKAPSIHIIARKYRESGECLDLMQRYVPFVSMFTFFSVEFEHSGNVLHRLGHL